MDDLLVKLVGDSLTIPKQPVECAKVEKNRAATLPTEIWVIIFTIVVDPESLCYDRCTSFDFPRFREELSMLSRLEFTGIKTQISNLRLVCRLWSTILEPTWRPYMITKNPASIGSYINIRALSIENMVHSKYAEYKPYPLDQSLLRATKNINTFMVSKFSNENIYSFIDPFFSYSGYFPSVRSFYYYTDQLPRNFWVQLEAAFPRLTTFLLFACGDEGGTVTLPDLEILDIRLLTSRPPTFSFPSLKHFTSEYGTEFASCKPILRTHGHHIESLLFPPYGRIGYNFFQETFWTQFPNLKLLGGAIDAPEELPVPPAGHPFDHLCLYEYHIEDTQKDCYQFSVQVVQNFLQHLPNLRYLSVLSTDPSQEDAQHVLLIDEYLRSKGGKRLEIHLYGDNISTELDQLRRAGSWQKESYYPFPIPSPFICTWEIKQGEDYSS